MNIMPEKKEKIIVEAIGKELPGMAERDKTYLMGFLEGLAAGVGNQQLTVTRAQQDSA